MLMAGVSWSQSLAPLNDILLLNSSTAANPLRRIGGNSVWGPGEPVHPRLPKAYAFVSLVVTNDTSGSNVYGISSDVPEGCTVQQAAYLVRHGSRLRSSLPKC